jgi:hypothetical protein
MRASICNSIAYFILLSLPSPVEPFTAATSSSSSFRRNNSSSRRPTTRLWTEDFLKQQAFESNGAYMKRLSELAGDPEAFERAVQGNNNSDAAAKSSAKSNTTGNNNSETKDKHKDDKKGLPPDMVKPNKGYQRVEDWEHDQQELLKQMTWEQRVQHEGQRDGNRMNQNEILRNTLKWW